MAQFTLTQAQRMLLGIIASVESGLTGPVDAFEELKELKVKAKQAGLNFTADYSEADFQKIVTDHASEYDSSEVYENSSSY